MKIFGNNSYSFAIAKAANWNVKINNKSSTFDGFDITRKLIEIQILTIGIDTVDLKGEWQLAIGVRNS